MTRPRTGPIRWACWDGRPHHVCLTCRAMAPAEMRAYGEPCGWTLARAHARSGDRIAITAYLGRSGVFDQAIAEFAASYAHQNERDYQALAAAAASGRVTAERDI